jgi:hypothetical protein
LLRNFDFGLKKYKKRKRYDLDEEELGMDVDMPIGSIAAV